MGVLIDEVVVSASAAAAAAAAAALDASPPRKMTGDDSSNVPALEGTASAVSQQDGTSIKSEYEYEYEDDDEDDDDSVITTATSCDQQPKPNEHTQTRTTSTSSSSSSKPQSPLQSTMASTNTNSNTTTAKAPAAPFAISLRMNYLLVTMAIMLADGLQGTHLYVLYESYGVSVASLFSLGFVAGALATPLTGPWIDKWGRKHAALLYCTLEMGINTLEQYPWFTGLIVSRMVGGITTNLLNSTFEPWLDTEYQKRDGYSHQDYEVILRDSMVVSNLAAIASGCLAHVLAEYFGPVGPFQGAVTCTAIAFCVIALLWTENYGSTIQGNNNSISYSGSGNNSSIIPPNENDNNKKSSEMIRTVVGRISSPFEADVSSIDDDIDDDCDNLQRQSQNQQQDRLDLVSDYVLPAPMEKDNSSTTRLITEQEQEPAKKENNNNAATALKRNNSSSLSSSSSSKSVLTYLQDALQVFRSDSRILRVAIIQGLTGGSLQIFIFLWSPTLQSFATAAAAASSFKKSSSLSSSWSWSLYWLDSANQPAYGLIFGAFMAAGVLGGLCSPQLRKLGSKLVAPRKLIPAAAAASSVDDDDDEPATTTLVQRNVNRNNNNHSPCTAIVAKSIYVGSFPCIYADEDYAATMDRISRQDKDATEAVEEDLPMAVEFLASICYCISVVMLLVPCCMDPTNSDSFQWSLLAFFIHEFSIGVVMPCEGVIRSIYMPADDRATMMAFPRMIVNLAVSLGVLLTNHFSAQSCFSVVATLMAVACILQLSLISKDEWKSLWCRMDRHVIQPTRRSSLQLSHHARQLILGNNGQDVYFHQEG